MIIHFCGNLMSSNVHKYIVKGIDEHSLERSLIFVPAKRGSEKRKNELLEWRPDLVFLEVPYWSRYVPFLRHSLTLFLLAAYLRRVDTPWTHIYAHSVWTDGLIAFLVSKLKNVEYTVFLRNTDYNVFFSIPLIACICLFIMKSAHAVIIPSVAYHKRVAAWVQRHHTSVNIRHIPNGVDQFWLDDRYASWEQLRSRSLVFVGKGDKNKNLHRTFNAIKRLHECGEVERFHVVGVPSHEFLRIVGLSSVPDWVCVHGTLGQTRLRDLYRTCSILVVPSIRETFGLVYVEALSQGCRVICSKGEGVSENFSDKNVVKAVNPHSTGSISEAISDMLRTSQSRLIDVDLGPYRWESVLKKIISERHDASNALL